jgi:hypothetical protein
MNAPLPMSGIIHAYLCENPHARTKDVAVYLGCSAPSVSTAKRNLGLTGGKPAPVQCSLTTENRSFVMLAAHKSGVSLSDFMQAIITDARLDEEEAANLNIQESAQ